MIWKVSKAYQSGDVIEVYGGREVRRWRGRRFVFRPVRLYRVTA